ncbi:Alpha/beta hydrolase [Kitasatospora sp. MMS16-BH015]|uniref:alpha/beta fold hydrolase n=1 Tax=Kitasatospora sp. MMS16-BH015 TaxID=2018025 RepID=UPI000CA0C876|nr:alpha/beta hydrolase [Kitasatospora sp. MMS16-BH015]AUG80611.1 Alpha/beta hydrolase [Kitasatospora sp. MMS16-BH015]
MTDSWDTAVTPFELRLGDHAFQAYSAGPRTGELVLLLHGFPEFADSWGPALPALGAAGYHAVAVDQRGYSPGARPEPVAAYAVPELVADVLGFAEALGAERFHLLAHDWGGLVAWALAARHPERLRTLAVLSTPHPAALHEALGLANDQAERSRYVQLFRAPDHAAERVLLAEEAAALRGAYRGHLPEEQVTRNVERLVAGALTGGLNWYRAVEGTLRVEAGPVTVPTLYVWGTEDQALGRDAAELTAKYVEGPYRFLALDGASHWLPECDHDRYLPAVLAHLAT